MDSDYVIAGDFNKDTGQVCAYNRQVISVNTNLTELQIRTCIWVAGCTTFSFTWKDL